MCIIIISAYGKEIPKAHLAESNTSNPDGIGIAWKNRGKILFKKGWEAEEFAKFHEFYKKNIIGKQHVVHFRIGTSGNKDKHMMHPFTLDGKNELEGFGNVVFQNGISYNYKDELLEFCAEKKIVPPHIKSMSDTAVIAFMLSHGLSMESAVKMGGKWVLFNKENVWYWGDFMKEGKNGLLYSNSSYKRTKYTQIGWDNNAYYGKPKKQTTEGFYENIKEKNGGCIYFDNGICLRDDFYCFANCQRKVPKSKYQGVLIDDEEDKDKADTKKAFGSTWDEDWNLYNLGE